MILLDIHRGVPLCKPWKTISAYRKALSVIVHEIDPQSPMDATIHVVDDATIRTLNRTYRKLDRVTDVLSFTYDAGEGETYGSYEIYIASSQAERQAKRYRITFAREFLRLLIHGILHAYGYDHMKKSERMLMRKQEHALMRLLSRLVV